MKKESKSLKNIIALQQNKIILNKERVQNEKDNQEKILNSYFKEKLGKLFSPTQISMLWSNKRRVFVWTNDDIASAISLRSVSSKAYRYLRDKKNFPLP
ncbi:THAP-type domain-containing protein, partial [Aphis craccivora]